MRRLLISSGVAFCVIGGVVLARFADGALPSSYLMRPLAVAAALAILIGGISALARRDAMTAAATLSSLVAMHNVWTLLVAIVLVTSILVLRIRGSDGTTLSRGVATMAAVFFVGSVVRIVPLVVSPTTTPASAEDIGPPAVLILLDGYPRADTLADLGIDIAPFVGALEERGFDHYPDAHTLHGNTIWTLTAMLTGEIPEDTRGTIPERRAARNRLRLPNGFVTIAPPHGHVVIPGAVDIGPGGINDFEVELLTASIFGQSERVGDYIMDEYRNRLEAGFVALERSDEERIFAHFLSPHTPRLYSPDGSPRRVPPCWPTCRLFNAPDMEGLPGTIAHLNDRLLRTIDTILERSPDRAVVVFSDHGGRFSANDRDEWHRSFLAARIPDHPGLFERTPRPDQILPLLGYGELDLGHGSSDAPLSQ